MKRSKQKSEAIAIKVLTALVVLVAPIALCRLTPALAQGSAVAYATGGAGSSVPQTTVPFASDTLVNPPPGNQGTKDPVAQDAGNIPTNDLQPPYGNVSGSNGNTAGTLDQQIDYGTTPYNGIRAANSNYITQYAEQVPVLNTADYGEGGTPTTPGQNSAQSVNSLLLNGTGTTPGNEVEKWWSNDIVGNLFHNIGQLFGKWGAELMHGWIAPMAQYLTLVLRVFVLNPNIAVNGITNNASGLSNNQTVDQVSGFVRAAAQVNFSIALDLLLLLFVLCIWKFWIEQAWRGGVGVMGAVGRLIATMALLLAWPTIYAFLTEISNEMISYIYVSSVPETQVLDVAVARAIESGIHGAFGLVVFATAPVLGSLAVTEIGGLIGGIISIVGFMTFLLLGVMLITELVYILIMKAIQTSLLTAQYMFFPIFLVFLATPETEDIAMDYIRGFCEVSLWTFVWVGMLKIMAYMLYSDFNPWGKIIVVIGLLQLMIQVPQFMKGAKIGIMSEFLTTDLLINGGLIVGAKMFSNHLGSKAQEFKGFQFQKHNMAAGKPLNVTEGLNIPRSTDASSPPGAAAVLAGDKKINPTAPGVDANGKPINAVKPPTKPLTEEQKRAQAAAMRAGIGAAAGAGIGAAAAAGIGAAGAAGAGAGAGAAAGTAAGALGKDLKTAEEIAAAHAVFGMKATDTSKLTGADIGKWTPAMAGALRPPSKNPGDPPPPAGGLTSEAVRGLSSAAFSALQPATFASLSDKVLASLSPEHARAIMPEQAAALSERQAALLTPAAVRAMNPKALAALHPATFAALNPQGLAGLTSEQMAAITPAQATALQPRQAAALSPATVVAMSPEALAAMSPAAFAALNHQTLAALSNEQSAALRPEQIAALSAEARGALSATTLAALSPMALAAFQRAQGSIVPRVAQGTGRPGDPLSAQGQPGVPPGLIPANLPGSPAAGQPGMVTAPVNIEQDPTRAGAPGAVQFGAAGIAGGALAGAAAGAAATTLAAQTFNAPGQTTSPPGAFGTISSLDRRRPATDAGIQYALTPGLVAGLAAGAASAAPGLTQAVQMGAMHAQADPTANRGQVGTISSVVPNDILEDAQAHGAFTNNYKTNKWTNFNNTDTSIRMGAQAIRVQKSLKTQGSNTSLSSSNLEDDYIWYENGANGSPDSESHLVAVGSYLRLVRNNSRGMEAARQSAVHAGYDQPQTLAERIAHNIDTNTGGLGWQASRAAGVRFEQGMFRESVRGVNAWMLQQPGNAVTSHMNEILEGPRYIPNEDGSPGLRDRIAQPIYGLKHAEATNSGWNPFREAVDNAVTQSGEDLNDDNRAYASNMTVLNQQRAEKQFFIRGMRNFINPKADQRFGGTLSPEKQMWKDSVANGMNQSVVHAIAAIQAECPDTAPELLGGPNSEDLVKSVAQQALLRSGGATPNWRAHYRPAVQDVQMAKSAGVEREATPMVADVLLRSGYRDSQINAPRIAAAARVIESMPAGASMRDLGYALRPEVIDYIVSSPINQGPPPDYGTIVRNVHSAQQTSAGQASFDYARIWTQPPPGSRYGGGNAGGRGRRPRYGGNSAPPSNGVEDPSQWDDDQFD